MNAVLQEVLAATGYMTDGTPAEGLTLTPGVRRGTFQPDASWKSPSSLMVYFKQQSSPPSDEDVAQWRREIWNEGFAPLLWVVSPARIDLYNGFGKPLQEGDAAVHRLRSFQNIDASLAALDAFAGRLAIETGQFWAQAPQVDRKTSVDQQLLGDLSLLEQDLLANKMDRDVAQALIGRVIFTQYLIDRGIVSTRKLKALTNHTDLPTILRDRKSAGALFDWLAETFNGDMFPAAAVRTTPAGIHLERVAGFLQAVDADSGQLSLFPYQFDIIPVELISSIYEQFAHAGAKQKRTSNAKRTGVHYTRLPLVSLVLDELMDDIHGTETVLDLTCGSGVFLVEALRRLVDRRAAGAPPTRELIRRTLHEQIYGVDLSEAAVRVAAFSLYLAALELDPDPQPAQALKFRPLIGRNLFVGDAHSIETTDDGAEMLLVDGGLRTFDLIVGNPPWTFTGKRGTQRRRKRMPGVPLQPRGEGFDFLLRAREFAGTSTRYGLVLSAMPFFSRSETGMAAAAYILREFAPVTLVNLANLRGWLFSNATNPAVAFFANHRLDAPADQLTVVQVPWTPAGPRTHTFEVAPSDVMRMPLANVTEQPLMLKAAAVGRRRDLRLLERLWREQPQLGGQLAQLDVQFRDGLTQGKPARQDRSASALKNLPLLRGQLKPLCIPTDLPRYREPKAQWPRERKNYRAPLLILKEMIVAQPRLTVAVADQDLIYSDSNIGAAFPAAYVEQAHLLAAILSSSLATWFLGLTASEYGAYKPKIGSSDLDALPMPNLDEILRTEPGRRLAELARALEGRELKTDDWGALDSAVADLYKLDHHDRVVVQAGLSRGEMQREDGRDYWTSPANTDGEMVEYATEFLSVISGWLEARNRRHMRAEVIDLPWNAPLRVVRFVLEEGAGSPSVSVVQDAGSLQAVLGRIGQRMKVRIATSLSVSRELRIHGANEVVVIKPAGRRHWMAAEAYEDADAVVAESYAGGAA